jgi:cyclophilin family peptidyl-prolyl cis-trans isomerase
LALNKLGLFFLFIVSFFFFTSCSNPEPEKKDKLKEYKKELEEKRINDSITYANLPKPDSNLINNDNVVNKLTWFEKENPETKVLIKTKLGNITIKLFDDTPLHRANFIMLTKRNYFDSTLFYRVVDNFMIQGGNSDRDDITQKMKEIGFYTIPDEIKSHHYHVRGSLAMAVSEQLDTPEDERNKHSSPFNFYIVQNGPLGKNYLKNVIKKYKLDLSNKEKQMYMSKGGAPHLDGNYTVFGQVTSGFDVIDKIAALKTNKDERPLDDITMSVEIIE